MLVLAVLHVCVCVYGWIDGRIRTCIRNIKDLVLYNELEPRLAAARVPERVDANPLRLQFLVCVPWWCWRGAVMIRGGAGRQE